MPDMQKQNKTDLRVIKTHENLRRSFLELLRKKSLKEITVKEICTMARCSRNTFYMHYQYKEDLYNELVEECIEAIKNACDTMIDDIYFINEKVIRQYIDNVITEMTKMNDIVRILIKSDESAFFQLRMTEEFYENFLAGYRKMLGKEPDEVYCLYAKYNASAIVGFILHWQLCTELSAENAKEILDSIHDETIKTIVKYMKDVRK